MSGDSCGMPAWFSTYVAPWFCGGVFVSSFYFISSTVCSGSGADYFTVEFSVYVKHRSGGITWQGHLPRIWALASNIFVWDSRANLYICRYVCMFWNKEASIRSEKAKNEYLINRRIEKTENEKRKREKAKIEQTKKRKDTPWSHNSPWAKHKWRVVKLWLHRASFRFFVFVDFSLPAYSFFRFFAFSFIAFSFFVVFFCLRMLDSWFQNTHTFIRICPGISERKYSSKARARTLGRWPCHVIPPDLCLTYSRLKILLWNNQRHLPRKLKMKWTERKIQTRSAEPRQLVRMCWIRLVVHNCRHAFIVCKPQKCF